MAQWDSTAGRIRQVIVAKVVVNDDYDDQTMMVMTKVIKTLFFTAGRKQEALELGDS